MIVGEWSKQGLANGWASLGYTNDWRKPPSEEEQYKIRRARMVKHMQQCGKLTTIYVPSAHSEFKHNSA